MTKPIYDIMLCADGATRAVKVINGVKVDPSLEDVKKQEALDKKNDEKKTRPKISIQDRIQNQVEDFISVVEGQADDFVDSALDAMGPITVEDSTYEALIKYARDSEGTDDRLRAVRIVSLIVSTPEYQFA